MIPAAAPGANNQDYKILSIDGGGIRGILPLKIMAHLEERHEVCFRDEFDLIAGTSTGGIIALGLSTATEELSSEDLLQMYLTRGSKIFKPNPNYRGYTPLYGYVTHNSRYTREGGLDEIAYETFGWKTLGDSRTDVLITAKKICDSGKVTCFTKQKDKHRSLYAKDVACATSAASTYFPQKQIGNRFYCDGGEGKNSPALMAYTHATAPNGLKIAPARVKLLSLSTGQDSNRYIDHGRGVGRIGYALNAVFMCNQAQVYSDHQMLKQSLNADSYFRCDPPLQRACDLDEIKPEAIDSLVASAESYIADNSDQIEEIAKMILGNRYVQRG